MNSGQLPEDAGWQRLASLWQAPWQGFERCLAAGWVGFAGIFGGLVASWWIYVPIHELLHASGCLIAGGSVSRLEIAPLYGGALWAKLVPFVVAESEYAGRLAGFSTHGSDLVYFVTVFFPYLLTLWPGVGLLLWAGRHGRAVQFGAALPVAFAPFISLWGDAYEIGSILATSLPPWTSATEVLRRDDFFLLVNELRTQATAPWGGALCGLLFGMLWASATYLAGHGLAHGLLRLKAGSNPLVSPARLHGRKRERSPGSGSVT